MESKVKKISIFSSAFVTLVAFGDSNSASTVNNSTLCVTLRGSNGLKSQISFFFFFTYNFLIYFFVLLVFWFSMLPTSD